MSGVEIVGFVLAALPLVISAVEHYRDGLDPLKDYVGYDRTLKSLRTRLRIQQDLFEGTLKRLLLEELTSTQARALFPDAGRDVDKVLWGTKEVDEKLHDRLGSKYENFMDVVCEMELAMRRLKEKLDFDIEQKPNWNGNTSLSSSSVIKRGKWEWRKIRRSFGRKERESLIQEFERYNGVIARYVDQREILAPSPKPRPDDFSKYYHIVRDNACELYEALDAGWKCRCSCSHMVNLQLERRNAVQASPLFKISLSFLSQSSHSTPAQKTWLEAQVNVDELDEQIETDKRRQGNDTTQSGDELTSIFALSTSSITTIVSLPITAGKKTSKSVTIREPDSSTKKSTKPQGPSSGIKRSQRAPQILSLCEAIQGAQSTPPMSGFLAWRKRCINISGPTSMPSNLAEPVSLDCLFPASNIPSQRHESFGKLSRQQRLNIAVVLAHAVLQLHDSPWLSESWSKNDIYFFSRGLDSCKRPVIDHPYVSRSFDPQTHLGLASSSAEGAAVFCSNLIINKSLFALGIVLIELCLNKRFEDLYAEARLTDTLAPEGPLSAAETYSVATHLIEAVYGEQGMQYGYVVQRCLKCEFGVQDSKKQLDFAAFRALVYEGVLAPLENDLKGYSME